MVLRERMARKVLQAILVILVHQANQDVPANQECLVRSESRASVRSTAHLTAVSFSETRNDVNETSRRFASPFFCCVDGLVLTDKCGKLSVIAYFSLVRSNIS